MTPGAFSNIRLVIQEMIWPFWSRSKDRWHAWGLLMGTAALVLGMVFALVELNHWNEAFYDALQNLNRSEFLRQCWRFFFIVIGYSFFKAYGLYTQQSLGIRWRRWLNQESVDRWLSQRNYYHWKIIANTTDNPDQRLSDDIRELTELSLEIGEKVFREFITFVSFIGILWALSGSFVMQDAFGYRIEVHKYLVWTCLLYALVGTWVAHRVGRPLATFNFLQERFEADFRYLLVRLRENSESVALLKGEERESAQLTHSFRRIVENFKHLIRRQRNLQLTNSVYGQVAYIFPFLVASPQVFTKEITLGRLFQICSAFQQVQGSVSVFVDIYEKLARWYSVVARLAGFLRSLEAHKPYLEKITAHRVTAPSISVHGLSLQTPSQKVLIPSLNLKIATGERVLAMAPPGFGKSTLVNLLNGLWPYFEGGGVETPAELWTLPQKTYLVPGALKESLAYPSSSEDFPSEAFVRALELAGLSHLRGSLDVEGHWDSHLSEGEQQQISFARLFLHRPKFVILDEITSTVDEATQALLYKNLLTQIQGLTLLSIGHRVSLREFHTRILDLTSAERADCVPVRQS